jgi:ABC-type transport system involved in multi-copper enzyme maturation permease subunit
VSHVISGEWLALLRAEWRRLFTRRLARVMMAVTILILALAGFAVAAHSHPHTPATLAQAQAFIAGQRAQNLDQCLADAKSGAAGPDGQPAPTEAECQQQAQQFQPSVEEFQGYQFTFRRDMSTLLVLLGGLLALAGFVIGSSFVGAEWSSGGMTTVLVWRPRRVRLLAGKLAALLLGMLTFAVLTSIAWTAPMWAVARTRGYAGNLTPGLLTSLALRDVRVLALTLACAAAGFAIASYGRHTAAALGTAIGYVVVVEVVLRIVLSAAHIVRPERFYLTSYVIAWLNNTTTYAEQGTCPVPRFGPGCQPTTWSIGAGHSALLISAILIATLVAAVTALRRRDVT